LREASVRNRKAASWLPCEFEVDWFVSFDSGCGPVDVWEIVGVEPETLVESPEGYFYFPGTIQPTAFAS
jgi:hypothetical protein